MNVEKDATYVYEYNIVSYSTSQIVVKDIKVYKKGSEGNVAIPVDIIPTGSYGNRSYTATWTPNSYTVTFDANGGTVETTQKTVSYGGTYDSLPTPTRSGYTFKGWNGKNLVNISDFNANFINKYYSSESSNPKYVLEPNTTYTLSFNHTVNSVSSSVYASIGYGSNDFLRDLCNRNMYSGVGRKSVIFTTPSTFDYSPANVYFRLVRFDTPSSADIDISNVQFEKGDKATPYEPYYITSDTTVVQSQNHTLTAIWEAN